MGWFKRVFGHGKVKIAFEGTDLKTGKHKTGTAKTEYEGEYDEEQVLYYFREAARFEYDVRVTKASVVDHITF